MSNRYFLSGDLGRQDGRALGQILISRPSFHRDKLSWSTNFFGHAILPTLPDTLSLILHLKSTWATIINAHKYYFQAHSFWERPLNFPSWSIWAFGPSRSPASATWITISHKATPCLISKSCTRSPPHSIRTIQWPCTLHPRFLYSLAPTSPPLPNSVSLPSHPLLPLRRWDRERGCRAVAPPSARWLRILPAVLGLGRTCLMTTRNGSRRAIRASGGGRVCCFTRAPSPASMALATWARGHFGSLTGLAIQAVPFGRSWSFDFGWYVLLIVHFFL